MKAKKWSKKTRAIVAGGVVVLFALCMITGDEKKDKATSATSASLSNPLTKSVDEAKSRFNSYADQAHFSYKIDNIEIKEAVVENSFDVHLSKLLVFGGALNKSDNSMKLLYAICSGDGTPASGENTIALMTAVIAVADPSLKPADRLAVLNKLGALNPGKDVANLNTNYSFNKVTYNISSTPEWVKLSASL